MTAKWLKLILSDPDIKGVVMYRYGAGNFPIVQEMLDVLKEAIKQGLVGDVSSRSPPMVVYADTFDIWSADRGQHIPMRSGQDPSAL